MLCPVCRADKCNNYSIIDQVQYYECPQCESLFADPDFMGRVESGAVENYRADYWHMELKDARQRSFGSSLQRVAETFLYARNEIKNFLDIGCGPGYLLDSFSVLLPESSSIIHGVELFPPPQEFRSTHANYHIGQVGDLPMKFDAGVCIEVIEHLTPQILLTLISQLAAVSNPGAVYLFNSGQPSFVKNEDPAYLDPLVRGHIISYSLKGLRELFRPLGFNVIPLAGRDWAFLAEFGGTHVDSADELLTRVWTVHPKNRTTLSQSSFGPLMYTMGIESARCYLESHIVKERTNWALALDAELASVRALANEG